MARPIKKGLDYFNIDTVFDDNVELLIAECGMEGLGILIKLWQKIYINSYYAEWSEDNALLFSKSINSELTTVNAVINVCFKRNIFDKSLHKQYLILTSKAVQKRYLKVVSDARRKECDILPEHNLLKKPELIQSKLELIHEESTQIKEKKIKEDKSTVNNKPDKKQKYLEFVLLTDDEYNKLSEKFGGDIDDYIERLNNYIGSTGKKYKSHYHTILTWSRKDKPKEKAKKEINYEPWNEDFIASGE